MSLLEIRGLRTGYGDVPILHGIDLAIDPGAIGSVVGANGAGKTTAMRAVAGILPTWSGEILFEGRDLLAASEAEITRIRRHKMGMVFQHFALLPHMSVLENVAFPLEVQGAGRSAREARARKMIALVGLEGREESFPRELSGGQQQRVGIARSLAADPELWFLDEPFSALDPLIRREMQDEFLRLQKILHKTIVFITHDFDEAIRLADRIAVMKDGAIEQVGTPEEIVLSPSTPYVTEFTRAVPRAKVIRLGSVMAAPGGEAPSRSLPATATVAEAAPAFLEGVETIGVTDADGRAVGQLERARVIEVMLGG